MSLAIARNIFRRFSAWRSSRLFHSIRPSLVTPSTSPATSGPNFARISSIVRGVSSGTSWSSAAATVTASSRMSARIPATATLWLT